MTTKRTTRDRLRAPPIDSETLALFVELSGVPKRRRDTQAFRERDRDLHERFGPEVAADRFCAAVGVLTSGQVAYRPGDVHYPALVRFRALRDRLLMMAGMKPDKDRRLSF
jgi:hypothetical protein